MSTLQPACFANVNEYCSSPQAKIRVELKVLETASVTDMSCVPI